MGSKRDARQFARRIDRIERTQRAMTRSRQIAFSDVPVIIDGVEVSVGVPDLLQESVNTGIDVVLAKQLAESAKLAADAAAEAAAAAEHMATEILETNVQPLEQAWNDFYGSVEVPLTMAGIKQDIEEADAAATAASGVADTAQAAAVAAQAKADALSARGENLVTNGSAELGDTTNWTSGVVFTPGIAPPGYPGAFQSPGTTSSAFFADELITVDPNATYSMEALFLGPVGQRHYLALAPYDIEGLAIARYHVDVRLESKTTLAADLVAGATTLQIASAAGWPASFASARVGFWPYVNGLGQTFQAEDSYTRNSVALANGTRTGTTLTLGSAYTGATIPAGTVITWNQAGSSYIYPEYRITVATAEVFEGKVGGIGVNFTGTDRLGFWPGTAKVRPGVLLNNATLVTGKSGFTGLRFANAEASVEAAAAQADADQAITDAYNARQIADKAAADVLLAQSKADSAFGLASTADGRVTVASTNPTANDALGKPLGAIWEVRAAGVTLRRYVTVGTLPTLTWEQTKIGAEYVGDKAIGRAQMGDAAIGTAQIGDLVVTNAKVGDLDGGKIWARSMSTEKFMVGSFDNMLADLVIFTGSTAPHAAGGYGTLSTQGASADSTGFNPGQHYWAIRNSVDDGIFRDIVDWYGTNGKALIPVIPNAKYRLNVLHRLGGAYSNGIGSLRWTVREYNAAGTVVKYAAVPNSVFAPNWDWNSTSAIVQVGPDTVNVNVEIQATAINAGFRFANPSMKATVATLIEPEGILTPMIGVGQIVTTHLHADVGKDLNISSNEDIILTAGAAQAAQGAAQSALEQVAPLTGLPDEVQAAADAAAAAASTASKGVTDAETAKKAAEAAQSTANTAKSTADTTKEDLRQHQMRYAFTDQGLVISQPGSENAVTMDNDSIEMIQSGVAVSYWKGGTFHADTLEADVMRFGKHQIEKYPLDSATPTGTIVKAI